MEDGVCCVRWGLKSDAGQPVRVSLNGVSYAGEGNIRFQFIGLHPPQLVDAYFSRDLTSLVMQFDSQPTNQVRWVGWFIGGWASD